MPPRKPAPKPEAMIVAANDVTVDVLPILERQAEALKLMETRSRSMEAEFSGALARHESRLNVMEATPFPHVFDASHVAGPWPPESPVEALEARVARLEAACAVQLGKHAKHAQAGAQAVELPSGE